MNCLKVIQILSELVKQTKPTRCALALCVFHALAACSGRPEGSRDITPKDAFARDVVPRLGFTRSLFAREPRLTGLLKSTQRLLVIDPAAAKEVWGADTSGLFNGGDHVTLPGQDSVGLVSPESFAIVNQSGGRQVFSVPAHQHWDVARGHPSFAFAAKSGRGFSVVRYFEGGAGGQVNLQEATFAAPWPMPAAPMPTTEPVPVADPAPPVGETVDRTVTFWSDDASRLVFFNADTGAWALYSAKSPGAPLEGPLQVCVPSSVPTGLRGLYVTASANAALTRMVVAGKGGQIATFSLDTNAPCLAADAWEQRTVMANAENISRVTLDEPRNRLLLMGANGQVMGLNASTLEKVFVLSASCAAPVEGVFLDASVLTLLCADSMSTRAASVGSFVTFSIDGVPRELARASTPLSNVAAVAIEPLSRLLFVLKDSGFGRLLTFRLDSGEGIFNKPLFLNGILEKL